MATLEDQISPSQLQDLYADHIARLEGAYADALDQTGFEAVVLHSGSLQKRTEADDQYWPFRPVPHFQHWLPLAAPDCALVIRPGRRPLLLRVREESVWEASPEPESDHWQAAFDIVEVDSLDALRAHLPREGVAVIGERRSPPAGWGVDGPLNPPRLVEHLDQLRV